jgi:hypothetical protein
MKRRITSTVKIMTLVLLVTASFYSNATAPTSETELVPADVVGFRHFGAAVAIDGNTAVIGVPLNYLESNAGAVYVFVRTGSTWSQQAKLTASPAAASSQFGSAVAISGDTLVVGAPYAPAGGLKTGAAYVFVRTGETWSQESRLAPTDAIGNDQFGAAVAVDGDTLAIGAIGTGLDSYNEGAVYVYARSGQTWSQQARLRSDNPGPGNEFGFSLALSNDTLAVGSPYDDDTGVGDAGAVYVFTGSGTAWNLQSELTASDSAFADLLGWSVALDGDTLVAGAPQRDSATAEDAGAAYVFVRAGGTWSQQAKLAADDAAEFDNFGVSVAVRNNTAVVGANYDSSFASYGGSAYLYTRTGSVWRQDSEFSAGNVTDDVQFGRSIALSGGTILVGAPYGYNLQDGTAYVFVLPDSNTAPVANPQLVSTIEATPVSVTLTGSDAESNPLTYIVVSGPTKGALSGTSPNLVYTPGANGIGSDSFTFKVNDGELDSAPATVSIDITPANHPPVADASATTSKVISLNNSDAVVTLDGSRSHDSDNDPLTCTWVESGNPLGTGLVGPVTLAVGTHSITLLVSDGAISDSATITVRVVTLAETISEIIDAVQTANMPSAQKTELIATLQAVAKSCARGNLTSAANQLQAFDKKVSAQAGKKIDGTTAGGLIAGAQAVIRIIAGGTSAN